MFSIVDLKLFSYIFDSPLSFLSFLWDNKKSTSVWIEYELQILALFVSWTWRFLTFKTIKSWTVSNSNYLASKGHWKRAKSPSLFRHGVSIDLYLWACMQLVRIGRGSRNLMGLRASWAWLKESTTFVRSPDDSSSKMTPHVGLKVLFCRHLFLYFFKRLQSVTDKLWQIGWVLSRIRDLNKRQVGRL